MNEAPLVTWMSANSFSGICWPAGRGHQDVADLLGVVAVLLLQAHDEVELLFPCTTWVATSPPMAVCDQPVDVGDIQAVARDLGAIDRDGEARLAELLHQRDVADAAHLLQHLLDRLALLLERLQVGAEHLDGQRALQAGLRLVHRIFGRLGVVEGDAGECLRACR